MQNCIPNPFACQQSQDGAYLAEGEEDGNYRIKISEIEAKELVFYAYCFFGEGYYESSELVTIAVLPNPLTLACVSGDVAVVGDGRPGVELELAAAGSYASGVINVLLKRVSDGVVRNVLMPARGGGWYWQDDSATAIREYAYQATVTYESGLVLKSNAVTVVTCSQSDSDSVDRLLALLGEIDREQREIFTQAGPDGFPAQMMAYLRTLEDGARISDLLSDDELTMASFTASESGAKCGLPLKEPDEGVLGGYAGEVQPAVEDPVPALDAPYQTESAESTMPVMTAMSDLAAMSTVSAMSDTPAMSAMSTLSGLTTMPVIPAMPDLAAMPAIPAMSAMPAASTMPVMTAMSTPMDGDRDVIHDNRAIFVPSFKS